MSSQKMNLKSQFLNDFKMVTNETPIQNALFGAAWALKKVAWEANKNIGRKTIGAERVLHILEEIKGGIT